MGVDGPGGRPPRGRGVVADTLLGPLRTEAFSLPSAHPPPVVAERLSALAQNLPAWHPTRARVTQRRDRWTVTVRHPFWNEAALQQRAVVRVAADEGGSRLSGEVGLYRWAKPAYVLTLVVEAAVAVVLPVAAVVGRTPLPLLLLAAVGGTTILSGRLAARDRALLRQLLEFAAS